MTKQVYTATTARSKIFELIDYAAISHEPILITGKRNNAVLINEEDWHAIEETLYLTSIPGMSKSIEEGMKESIDNCFTKIKW